MPIGAEDIVGAGTGPLGGMPVTVVAGLRGGTGSTTVAVNLALLLTGRGRRACLVDLSTASGHVPLHLHLSSQHHWGHLLELGDTPDASTINQAVNQSHPSGVAVLAAPTAPTVQTLSHGAVQTVLDVLAQSYHHLVVDVPALDMAGLGALEMARTVVLVMTDDPPSLQTAGQFLVALQSMGVDLSQVRVVLNHVRPMRDIPADTIQKALKRPLAAEIPFDPNQANAIRRGVPLVAGEPEGGFARAMQQLVRATSSR
jgi:pilus assembly protein CpaE